MKSIKNYFTAIVISLITIMSFSSCTLTAYAQDDMYDATATVSYSTIITYGTPFYIGNVLSYYIYNGWYYYPYIWNNHRYFHPFRSMQPRGFVFHPQPGFRPINHPGDFSRPMNRGGLFGPRQSSTRMTQGSTPGGRQQTYRPGNSGTFSRQPMQRGGQPGGMQRGGQPGGQRMGGRR